MYTLLSSPIFESVDETDQREDKKKQGGRKSLF